MPNSLGLDDDLDSVEVMIELEHIFGVKVSNEEAAHISTVGQFHDLLVSKLPPTGNCASSMTFFRIRGALRRLGYGDKLTPASETRFLERGGTRKNLKKLEVESGLHMPETISTLMGRLAALGGFIVTMTGIFSLHPSFASALLGAMVGLGAAGAILIYGDPGELPPDCRTLGNFTRAAAALNFIGGGLKEEDVWENLVQALSGRALPKHEISRETFFLQSQLKKRYPV